MDSLDHIRIPLRNRHDEIVAYALVNEADAGQAEHAWGFNGFYAMRKSAGQRRSIYLHREILGLEYGDGLEVDHVNRDKLDNRRSNLRIVTHARNLANVPSRGGTSAYRGVSWKTANGQWIAQATLAGANHYLGLFTSEAAAARAVNAFWTERGYDAPNVI